MTQRQRLNMYELHKFGKHKYKLTKRNAKRAIKIIKDEDALVKFIGEFAINPNKACQIYMPTGIGKEIRIIECKTMNFS